jgi:hypothetical protein
VEEQVFDTKNAPRKNDPLRDNQGTRHLERTPLIRTASLSALLLAIWKVLEGYMWKQRENCPEKGGWLYSFIDFLSKGLKHWSVY